MEVAAVERRALIRGRDVLIDMRCIAVRDQDLEIVAADDAFESDCPCRIGVHGLRQIAILRRDLPDDAQAFAKHHCESDRHVERMFEERALRGATHLAPGIGHECRDERQLGAPRELSRENRLRES